MMAVVAVNTTWLLDVNRIRNIHLLLVRVSEVIDKQPIPRRRVSSCRVERSKMYSDFGALKPIIAAEHRRGTVRQRNG